MWSDAFVQPIDEELRELGANPGIPLREPVRELEHRRPNDVLRSRTALSDEVSADERRLKGPWPSSIANFFRIPTPVVKP